MNVKSQLVEKTSQNGSKYICLEVNITEDYKKIVFLDKAEIELIKLISSK